MLKESFSLIKWDILHSRSDQSVNQEDMLVDTAVMVMTQVDMAMMMDIMTKVTAMGPMITMALMIAMDTVAMVEEAGVAATAAVKRFNSYSIKFNLNIYHTFNVPRIIQKLSPCYWLWDWRRRQRLGDTSLVSISMVEASLS